MGAGFALFLPSEAAAPAVECARLLGYGATLAGEVRAGVKQLVIDPLHLGFAGADLVLR
jgi:phosphoribosylformylglycinamidine cyclo-ligase